MKYVKQPKRYLALEDDEWRVLVKGLNEFRKQIIDDDGPVEVVNEVGGGLQKRAVVGDEQERTFTGSPHKRLKPFYGVRIKVIRIFNTYGPRMAQHDGRVVSNFIMQALRGEDITIYGNGKQTRSFQYVSDLVEGMIRMMNSEDEFTGPVNIGNPGEFTMLELAEKVIEFTGSKSKIVFQPLPQDDPKMRRPDITLAKSKLDWEPKVKLDEGLMKTIEYFKTTL